MDAGRRIEFALLYVGAPLAMALAMPPDWLWPVFLGVTLAALGLLALTPGFAWHELVRGGADGGVDWGEVALVALATAAAAGVLVWLLVPGQALALPRRAPGLWVAILVVYPVLSALPQEVVFRALFFRRYGRLFPGTAGLAVNALAFGLAHLMFWNWVAALLSVAGGAIFARGYLRRGFLQAVLLHAVAGGVIFTSGLGVFFYHGAVGR
ncbi:MAG TPA: CPBP family intramembrane glutamic endopeptidase [Amaricoccus sp.]|nr:CPBP family intramembrane glutamic endopeptidase [Amaricoccus sp.]